MKSVVASVPEQFPFGGGGVGEDQYVAPADVSVQVHDVYRAVVPPFHHLGGVGYIGVVRPGVHAPVARIDIYPAVAETEYRGRYFDLVDLGRRPVLGGAQVSEYPLYRGRSYRAGIIEAIGRNQPGAKTVDVSGGGTLVQRFNEFVCRTVSAQICFAENIRIKVILKPASIESPAVVIVVFLLVRGEPEPELLQVALAGGASGGGARPVQCGQEHGRQYGDDCDDDQ